MGDGGDVHLVSNSWRNTSLLLRHVLFDVSRLLLFSDEPLLRIELPNDFVLLLLVVLDILFPFLWEGVRLLLELVAERWIRSR